MSSQNNFGTMSIEYDKARRGYPSEVFEYLKSFVKENNISVLDLGCGTGISTRQLKDNDFEVIGVDKDSKMIEVAIQKSPKITYITAPADKLPFQDNHFDIITAFTAFHWFNDERSLIEIKRVLKNNGIFFTALKTNRKNENEEFKKGYFSILKKYAGDNFDTTKNHFNKEFIIKTDFSDIREKSFPVDELYTVEESLLLLQSLSLWNLVSDDEKPKMLEEMKKFYESHLVNGFVIRNREISIITAFKR